MALDWVCADSRRRSASRMRAEARSNCTGSIFFNSESWSVNSSRSTFTMPGANMLDFASPSAASSWSMMSYTVVNSSRLLTVAGSSSVVSRRSGISFMNEGRMPAA